MLAALLAVVALVTYVVLTAAARPGGPAPVAGVVAAAPSGATSDPSPLPLPAPVQQRPTLGVSVATAADLARFVEVTGTRPEVVDVFEPWSADRPLPGELADAVVALGSRLSVTWEPWDPSLETADQPDFALATITEGRHDDYVDRFARSVRDLGVPVTIRLMHEMNGTWYPWGAGVNGNRDGDLVAAWQHVRGRFAAVGALDVTWMWAPNAVFTGSAPLTPLYPGDEAVDAVGVSNYNWGDRSHDGFATSWRTFGSLFDASIAELRALTDRPLWIAEVASSNSGGSKADWLGDVFLELQARPEVAGLVWFDQVDDRHGVDWRIETEPETTTAWTSGHRARQHLSTENTGAPS